MERSHSGRVHRLGKAAYCQRYREFESPPLREEKQPIFKGCFCIGRWGRGTFCDIINLIFLLEH